MNKFKIVFLSVLLANYSILTAQEIKDTLQLKEVIIESQAYPKPIESKLNFLQIQTSNKNDLGDFFRSIPNVSGIRRGGIALDPVVRGFKYSQLNVQLDEAIKIEGGCPNRMDPVASHIEIEDIAEINVIKGPYALRYGPSFGGLIQMKLHQPQFYDNFQVHGRVNMGYESNWEGHKNHVALFGGSKKIAFLASSGYKDYGNYKDGNGNVIKAGFNKYNYLASVSYKPNSKNIITAKYIESHGRDVLYPALPMDEVSDDTRIIGLDYSYSPKIKNWEIIQLNAYHSNVLHVMDNSKRANYATMQAIAKAHAMNYGGKIQSKWSLGNIYMLTGADYEHVYKDGNRNMKMIMNMGGLHTVSEKNINLWQDAHVVNIGVFQEMKYVKNTMSYAAAVRYDNNQAYSGDTLVIQYNDKFYFDNSKSLHHNLLGTLTANKKINKNLSTGIIAGYGTRSPNLTERYIKFLAVGFDNYDYLGNPDLLPEKNLQGDIYLEFSHLKFGLMRLNGFYSYVTDYITAEIVSPNVARPKTQGVIGVKQFVNKPEAYIYGFEWTYNSSTEYNWGVEAKAAYTHAIIGSATQYIVQNNQVIGEVEVTNDAIPEIPPLEGTLNVNYKFFNGILVPQFAVRLVNPQNHVSSAFYEKTTPGFQTYSASINYQPNQTIRMMIGCNNITDLPYYEHLNRKIIGSTNKLMEPGRVFYVTLLFDF